MKKRSKKTSSTTILLCVAAAAALLLLVGMLLLTKMFKSEPNVTEPTVTETTIAAETEDLTGESTEESSEEPDEESTEASDEKPVMLDYMAAKYAENPDIVGWIRIDGTVVDYPVMFTPDDPEKYLRTDFNGNYKVAGELFVDGNCSMEPESDNLIIYGHNMKNGTMFRTLMSYEKESFWKEHPLIQFSTLYEERTYEVVAAFYDKVYKKTDTNFKFYQFIDAETEEAFNEAITYYKAHDQYETGVTPEFGDDLLTLVTCAYHVDYGRFVVIARCASDAT